MPSEEAVVPLSSELACPLCGGKLRRDPPGVYKFEFTCKKCGTGYFGESMIIVRQVLKAMKHDPE